MFSLIISIIAIALVAALAGASVYYGGSAFNKGTAGADASTLVNGGQQINGAAALATNDSITVAAMSDLVSDYLAQAPSYKGTSFTLVDTGSDGTADVAQVTGVDGDGNQIIAQGVCEEVQKRNGKGGTIPATAAGDTLFECFGDGSTTDYTFQFNL